MQNTDPLLLSAPPRQIAFEDFLQSVHYVTRLSALASRPAGLHDFDNWLRNFCTLAASMLRCSQLIFGPLTASSRWPAHNFGSQHIPPDLVVNLANDPKLRKQFTKSETTIGDICSKVHARRWPALANTTLRTLHSDTFLAAVMPAHSQLDAGLFSTASTLLDAALLQMETASREAPQQPRNVPKREHQPGDHLPGVLICDENLQPLFANPTIREWVGTPHVALETPLVSQLRNQLLEQWPQRKPAQITFDRQTQIAIGGAGYADLQPFELEGKAYVVIVLHHGAPHHVAQRELALAASKTALSQLAGGLIHEINNPTTSILINAKLLQLKNISIIDAEESAQAVAEQAERIASLTRMLQFSTDGESMELQRLPINHVLSTVMKLHMTRFDRERIRTEIELDSAEPEVLCRKDQIVVTLVQLIHNARLALNSQYPGESDNKLLHVRTGTFTNDGKSFLQIMIADDGIGLESEIVPLVFTPFFSAWPHHQRAGMGLFVARNIARAHGGDVLLIETPKFRTAFALHLPL